MGGPQQVCALYSEGERPNKSRCNRDGTGHDMDPRGRVGLIFLATVAALAIGRAPVVAQNSVEVAPAAILEEADEEGDHHEGYYYPKPQSVENYVSPLFTLPESDKTRRQAFVIGMTRQLLGSQYAPSFALFAKGTQSDKLIIVGMVDGQLNTIYRVRALLATFTSVARATQFFQTNTVAEDATFFDFLKLLGFRRVTITDGREFTHQITIN